MSGINERYRREIQTSGSPLAKHSINQKKTERERWGERRLDGTSGRDKKTRRAKERRRQEEEQELDETIAGATEIVAIAPKGIVFPEDLVFH